VDRPLGLPPLHDGSGALAYESPMKTRVVVLGAGFGGLELATLLSEGLGDRVDLVLIDKNEAFVFGFSKLDIIFGEATLAAVRHPYRSLRKPGVRFRQETVTAIDPVSRRVTTERGTYDADILVVALGADYDLDATPGLAEAGHEFYSVAGAERLAKALPRFTEGHAVVGVCGAPFKCPPAPSEAALLLHDFLVRRRVRKACEISLVMPFDIPIPVSKASSRALLDAFAERGIHFVAQRTVREVDAAGRSIFLDNGERLACDLFLGVPKHLAPEVLRASGMTEDGWVPVRAETLQTKFPGVYAIGDVADLDVPKAGLFAEGAARTVAASLLADLAGGERPPNYAGAGACYVEFGDGRVGRTDVDFLSGPSPTARFSPPSLALAREKREGAASRIARWFGR
jgi:sulfide:quinone oxidoreductase